VDDDDDDVDDDVTTRVFARREVVVDLLLFNTFCDEDDEFDEFIKFCVVLAEVLKFSSMDVIFDGFVVGIVGSGNSGI
jgi:hypothetical protein